MPLSRSLLFFVLVLLLLSACSDRKAAPPRCPRFGEAVPVTIEGYDGDAMEPFLSRDGRWLFFNSLNDGVTTSIYYAGRVSDTLFRFEGPVEGVNGLPPHLDAVPSMDLQGHFYFITTRGYPDTLRTLRSGIFTAGKVEGVHVVPGDFYKLIPGWLIMGAEIGREGKYLTYTQARFRQGPVPEEAFLGMARWEDTLFCELPEAGGLLARVNDPACLVYGVAVDATRRELYFTRLRKGDTVTEICVAVRDGEDEPFGEPCVLVQGAMAEAPTLSDDGRLLYFHRRDARDGKYHIFLMRRR